MVAYRKKNTIPFISFNISGGNTTSTMLTNLSKNTEYEIKILSRCGVSSSQYSGLTVFKTLNGRFEEQDYQVNNLEVYPNPSNGIFDMTFSVQSTSTLNDKIVIQVFDMTGKIVFNQVQGIVSGLNQISFDLSNETNGVYIIKSQIGTKLETMKIVKN